ncbi:hypothetical protein CO178_01795 [candidate division WWE3 bacterium CG_4_9_14_3_um_filter_34_6]|uniref:Glycosyltransferase RgtA/B/C/D-like domain-containing protein n=1 Tax=candidate division WWE3 bacterium CG_4_9_14_3_um_filter_34_6 TaxID=1975079 RepID=A0A2M7X391_UNCKA|nr:MAG: hypothetical protein CO178_01795 [candidate division WWE3 bacterium CG_4_9_14_3_um_filter_34_6]
MGLSHQQKKFIKKNIKGIELSKIATDTGLMEQEILDYLKGIWKKEKYEKFVLQLNNTLEINDGFGKKDVFDFKSWIKREKYILLGLLSLVLFAYFNGLNNGFVSDDIGSILNNPNIKRFVVDAFTIAGIVNTFMLYIVYKFAGASELAFRATNLLFHSGCIFVIYLIFEKRFSKKLGIIVATIFAVHPLLVESITWISGGPYARYSFFFLTSFAIFILGKSSRKTTVLSSIFFILAILSSEKAVPLILIYPLYDFVFRGQNFKLKNYISYFITAGIFSIAFFGRIGQRISGLQSDYYNSSSTFTNPFLQIPIAITEYLKLIIWPIDLSLYHSELNFSQQEYLIRLFVFLIFVGVIIYSYWRIRGKNFGLMIKFWKAHSISTSEVENYKFIFFWLLFFLISLSVTLTPFGISWIVAERYVYLGSVGIFAVVGLFISRLLEVKGLKNYVWAVFAVAVIALSIRTIIRNGDWKNEDTLWTATAKTAPSSPNTHNNMGDVYVRNGEFEKAVEEFKMAIQINPNYADAYHNLANTYQQMAEFNSENSNFLQLSIDSYNEAIKYNPNLWQSYQNIGIIYFNAGDYENSIGFFEKAFSKNPNINLAYNLALVYSKADKPDQAKKLLLDILAVDPSNQRVLELISTL